MIALIIFISYLSKTCSNFPLCFPSDFVQSQILLYKITKIFNNFIDVVIDFAMDINLIDPTRENIDILNPKDLNVTCPLNHSDQTFTSFIFENNSDLEVYP